MKEIRTTVLFDMRAPAFDVPDPVPGQGQALVRTPHRRGGRAHPDEWSLECLQDSLRDRPTAIDR
jgi:hypothetical protein